MFLLSVLLWLLTGCNTTGHPPGNLQTATHTSAEWHPSPNFGPRKPNFIILHHTSDQTVDEALHTLTSPNLSVSSHYLIGRRGELIQLVDEGQRAWHAGESWWGGQTDMNSASIGIELDNNGFELFPAAQIETLIQLLHNLRSRHQIPAENILGHADIAPGRKVDPSALFPWATLAQNGLGRWCSPPVPAAPDHFDPLLGLAAIGYDTHRPQAAIAAFKLHFAPQDKTVPARLTPADTNLIFCLLEQSRGSTTRNIN